MTPKISICIPTYNRAGRVSRCIKSALSNTYENIEVIVIDDGSTDNTWDILEKITDPRVKIYKGQHNFIETRNKLYQLATGDYIFNLDSDDMILPKAIETAYNGLKETNADLYLLFSFPGMLFKKSVLSSFDNAGIPYFKKELFDGGEDQDFIREAQLFGYKRVQGKKENESLYQYMTSSDSLSVKSHDILFKHNILTELSDCYKNHLEFSAVFITHEQPKIKKPGCVYYMCIPADSYRVVSNGGVRYLYYPRNKPLQKVLEEHNNVYSNYKNIEIV